MWSTPAAEAATYRSGTADDPQESMPTLDGSPRSLDVSQVRAYYDTAGTVQVVVRFHDAVPNDTPMDFTIYFGGDGLTPEASCAQSRDAYLRMSLGGLEPYNVLGITGYEGTVDAEQAFSADRREVYLRASHGALADRSFDCTDGGDLTVTAAICRGCVTNRTVSVDDVDDFPLLGSQPPEPMPVAPVCADRLDNDSDRLIDARDLGCRLGSDERLSRTPRYKVLLMRSDLARVLRSRFGSRFGQRRTYVPACRRTSRTSFACRPSWRSGTLAFRGTVRLSLARRGETIMKVAKGSIRRLKSQCVQQRRTNSDAVAPCVRRIAIQQRRTHHP